jgi:OOP family OmpA-OmpF porin
VNNSKKIALAVAMLCCAGTTLAQDINPSWYVQGSVVGAKVDHDFLSDETNWGLGLKFGKPVHPYWDIQFGGSYLGVGGSDNNYRQGLLGVDALLMFSRKNFRPFVLFGVGYEHDKIERPGVPTFSANSPYYTAGLGFQLGLSPQWSMQADVRTVRGSLDEDDFGFSRSNNKYLNIAFNYAFSKPAPPPPPPPPPAPPVVEAPPPAPPPPPPPPPARFEKVTLSSTELFGFNSATLSMPQPKLDEIAAALQADPSITDVDVVGYADRLGSKKYNLKLSQRRAESVRDYLVSKGVDGKRLKATGKGSENPVATCEGIKKRAELIKCLEPNRRVEVEQITVEKKVE